MKDSPEKGAYKIVRVEPVAFECEISPYTVEEFVHIWQPYGESS